MHIIIIIIIINLTSIPSMQTCKHLLLYNVLAVAVFLGIWQFGLPEWCMIIMAALVAFHALIELILIIHRNARILCKCCYKSKPICSVYWHSEF